MSRQRALVICPGRGVYNASELGYLAQHHADKAALIAGFDDLRNAAGQEKISSLDGAQKFSASKMTRGDNASGLIYACSYADFVSIDRSQYEIVGVTGNSMGWYTALACAGALLANDGFKVVNSMGKIMHDHAVGGQMLYPFTDDEWRQDDSQLAKLRALSDNVDGLFISINLGGMIVFAGTDEALKKAAEVLPPQGSFPMCLPNHAGFHCELQRQNSERGKAALPASLFTQPEVSLIDGRGHMWLPGTAKADDLWGYTFGHQIVETYDYTRAVISSIKELCPDVIIILGPGSTMGGATAQALISFNWRGLDSKTAFAERQKINPYIHAMGLAAQRQNVAR